MQEKKTDPDPVKKKNGSGSRQEKYRIRPAKIHKMYIHKFVCYFFSCFMLGKIAQLSMIIN